MMKLSLIIAQLHLAIWIWIDIYIEKGKVVPVHAMKACRGMEL
jgi:hypothetical protein